MASIFAVFLLAWPLFVEVEQTGSLCFEGSEIEGFLFGFRFAHKTL
jgi:hypothetical protein